MAVTIWHNPACSTSRNTLAMIREAGIEPAIVEYLKTPPDAATLSRAIADAGLDVSAAVRRRGGLFDELGLAEADDAALIAAMVAHPALIERPFVFTDRGVRLCRPAERVKEVL